VDRGAQTVVKSESEVWECLAPGRDFRLRREGWHIQGVAVILLPTEAPRVHVNHKGITAVQLEVVVLQGHVPASSNEDSRVAVIERVVANGPAVGPGLLVAIGAWAWKECKILEVVVESEFRSIQLTHH